ncbi:MAG: patatin-like phospholipase family protein [Pseudomonadota bacterium]
MTFRVICCDGGGIRGLVSALLIKDLDECYGVIGKAEGFVGTSTGGIIALGLAAGVPIDTIVDVYMTKGAKIFETNGLLVSDDNDVVLRMRGSGADEELQSGPGLFSCQYTNKGLIEVVRSIVGEMSLKDAKVSYVGVNTARLHDPNTGSWQPVVLSNAKDSPYQKVAMLDAALATSAAPTYFPPYQIQGLGYFADGGVFANNPSLAAITDLTRQGGASLSDISMLSLGTGSTSTSIEDSAIGNPLSWGAAKWLGIRPWAGKNVPKAALVSLTMDSTATLSTYAAQQWLGDAFARANPVLQEPFPLDDYEKVEELAEKTRAFMKTAEWADTKKWVEARWG